MAWLVLIVMKLEHKGFFFPPYYFIIIHKHVYIKTHFYNWIQQKCTNRFSLTDSFILQVQIAHHQSAANFDSGRWYQVRGELTFDPRQKETDGLWWFSSQCIGWSRRPCDGMCDTMVQRWCIDSCATSACTCRMLLKSFGTQTETSVQGP